MLIFHTKFKFIFHTKIKLREIEIDSSKVNWHDSDDSDDSDSSFNDI